MSLPCTLWWQARLLVGDLWMNEWKDWCALGNGCVPNILSPPETWRQAAFHRHWINGKSEDRGVETVAARWPEGSTAPKTSKPIRIHEGDFRQGVSTQVHCLNRDSSMPCYREALLYLIKPNGPLKIALLFIVFPEFRAAEQNILMPCSEKDADINQWCNWQTSRHLSVISGQIPHPAFPSEVSHWHNLFHMRDWMAAFCFLLPGVPIMGRWAWIYQLPKLQVSLSHAKPLSQLILTPKGMSVAASS